MKQVDWASDNVTTRGGKRDGAGRKPSGKQTVVVRVDAELLPLIEQLKQGLNPVTDKQAELDKLLEVNALRVSERDTARAELFNLKSQLTRIEDLRAENKELKAKLSMGRQYVCQCLTAKGDMCGKTALHENKFNGFVVWTCERHYKTTINKQ